MKPYYHKVSLLLVIISILLASCKNEAPYFMRSYYCVNCFLDSNNVYSLEETVGRSLDASCSISNENEGVAELRVETGKHIVIPKKIGYTHLELIRGEEQVSVMILVKTEAIDYWKITDRRENVDCAPELKERISSDIYKSQVLPQLYINDDVYFGYGSKGVWYMTCLDHSSSCRDDFYVDYAKGDAEYKFYAWPDMDKKQSFTFSLDEVRPYGEEPTKYGTFTCDLTDYYQQKYGQDDVRRVVLSYKVRSFHMIF